MKRKIMTLALIVFVIIINTIPMVNASSKVNATLDVNKSSIEQGDTFALSVKLSENNLMSYNVKILFDSSSIECISNSQAGITVGADYVVVSKNSTSDDLVGGIIANINFRAKTDAKIGLKAFTIDNSATSIKKADDNDVTGTLGQTSINVIEKVLSSNNNLSSLKFDVGILTPSFDKNITSYTLVVENNVETINVDAKAEDFKFGKISIEGNKNLVEGNNLYTIIVTAEDGSSKKYSLNVIRKKDLRSSNTNLKSLKVNRNDILSSRTLTVKNNVSLVDIVAETENDNAKVSGDVGIKELVVGENTFKVTVTAENGDIKVYEFIVTRSKSENVKNLSANANLRSLLVDGVEVTGFSPTTYTYEVKVNKNKTSAVISAVKDDENATVSGIGPVELDYGVNTVMVRVIAENEKSNNIYILNLISGGKVSTSTVQTDDEEKTEEINPESNNYLKTLEVNNGVLSPKFKKNISSYTLVVGMDVEDIDVTALPDYEKATVEVMGNTGIKEGLNNITIIVTAEDGTKRVYTINVTKTENLEVTNANLQSITINGVELLPEFNSNTLDYTCTVKEDVTSLDIVALATKDNANVEITGNDNFVSGENFVNILVTAEDGITTKTYVIKVIKDSKTTEEVVESTNDINVTNPSKEVKSNVDIIVTLIIATYVMGILGMFLVYKRENELNKIKPKDNEELSEKNNNESNNGQNDSENKTSEQNKVSKSEDKNTETNIKEEANESKETTEKK